MIKELEDIKINVKIKLSALWITLMLIFIYADLFGFFIPGHIEEVITFELREMTQIFLLGFMIYMTIPSLMVILSLTLKARINRIVNIIIGIFQALFVVAGIADPNFYFVFASIVETVLLSLIVWNAWKWPTQES